MNACRLPDRVLRLLLAAGLLLAAPAGMHAACAAEPGQAQRLEEEINRRMAGEQRRDLFLATSREPRDARLRPWLAQVIARIECMGTRHYPPELAGRSARIIATLRIAPDGTLERTEIDRSSGDPRLDANVERIARLAAPFAPLPPGAREQYRAVSVTTTFSFGRSERRESAGC